MLPIDSMSESSIREFPLTGKTKLTVIVNARVEFIYSAIIQDLIRNPDCLLLEDLGEISFDCLEFLMSLNEINIKDEDNILRIVGK